MANPHSALIREWEEAKAKGIAMEYTFTVDTEWLVEVGTASDPETEVRWLRPDGEGREPSWLEDRQYRIRPIPLRQLEVILKHEPMTEEPEAYAYYYVPKVWSPENPHRFCWTESEKTKEMLAAGLCYATAEGAVERAWAMRRTGRG